ncbi:MucR family transcriptional regulator [Modestobacter sp. DSM 44400]|uniref:MucR family transcriptional regulator n=1 Tax=Modestobacter sp. DSM 44400 TaxID=1550230 RepID=UPI000B839436|nr:MucR family transcriptional regulator [Modestobacter sp. DSM 44400]
MLHPVGPQPAAVYWRRRAVLLGLVVAVLVGGGWLAVAAATGPGSDTSVAAAATREAGSSAATPSLEQVVPSLAAVQVPTPAPSSTPAPVPDTTPAPPAAPALVDGGPCTDDMISVDVRPSAPTVAVGDKPTLVLVVTNTSPVSCTRALDKGLQEIVLLDGGGGRVWGSNDCFPESSSDVRPLPAGQAVDFPIIWGGLTSEPTCTAPRVAPAPGTYVLRGRLDTKLSADAALNLT